MRQGQGPNNNRRSRGRHHNGGGGHNGGSHSGGHNPGNGGGVPGGGNRPRSAASLRHQTFDSNAIDVRVRGNAWQVHEKYQALARDAQSSGDRVAAENYLQHAEHYYRIIEAINEATAAEQRTRGPFNQQPEMPASYYPVDGNQPQPTISGNIEVHMGNQPQPPMQNQAEVQPRVQPQSPFFSNEEVDDSATQPLAVNS